MKYLRSLATVLAALVMAAAAAPPPRLPDFAGWQKGQSAILAPAALPERVALAEYGLQFAEQDTYQRGDRKIAVTGFRFADAAGAYGAFTFFRPEEFHPFDLAQPREQAASGNTLILFTRGQWLVRVQMDQLTAMTASEMRQFAAALAPTAGNELALPSLPLYLPRQGLLPSTVRLAEGPAGLGGPNGGIAPWLPAGEVGFDHSAEVIVAGYNVPLHESGSVQLAVISYPTPLMARTRLAAMSHLEGVAARRSGPLLVLTHAAGNDAASLLDQVNYDADITLVPPTPVGIDALPSLILSILLFCGVLIAVAIVVGLLTGGARVLLMRVLPQRFHRPPPEPLIRLHLK